ncbi:unnamed protein product [Calypogeia fissa]
MASKEAQQAALGVAKKGLGMMFSASKAAASAISAGVQKVRKGYANKHELGVLNELKAKGLAPVEHLVQAMQRFYYLMMASYTHELQAAALLSAKRLTDPEKSTVPLDVVTVLGGVLFEESLKYGDFQRNVVVQGMQDFLNKARMGKDHYDRDSIAHDIYYAVLICAEEFETDWDQMQGCFREAVTRTVEWAASTDLSPDVRARAAKSVYLLGQAVKTSAQQWEEKRQKNIKDAETMLKTEQQRRNLTSSVSLPNIAGSSSHQYNNQYPTPQNNLQSANSAPPSNGNYDQYAYPSAPPSYQNYRYVQPSKP